MSAYPKVAPMNSTHGVRITEREGWDGLRCRHCDRKMIFVWFDRDGEPHAFWCPACDRNK